MRLGGALFFFSWDFSVGMALEGVGITDCFGFDGLQGRYPDDTACDPARTRYPCFLHLSERISDMMAALKVRRAYNT